MDLLPISSPPTVAEMQSRLAKVRDAMAQQDLDYYVSECPDNVFYLTNFANFIHERPFVLVVPRSGNLMFVVPKLEIPHVKCRAVGDIDLVPYFEFPAPKGDAWSDRFKELMTGTPRVGVESVGSRQVHDEVPGTCVRADIIDDARQVKSDYELSRIIYTSNLATGGMTKLLGDAKPGMSLLEVNSLIKGTLLLQVLIDEPSSNLLCTDFGVIFQPPSVSHDPHNFTDVSMAMEEGGPNVALINGRANGYGTEVERTFFLGQVPDAARRPYEVMMEVRQKAFELSVPGNVMGEVDEACNAIFKQAGYGDNLLHRTGHSIGVTGHEGPFLAQGYERVIEPGMLFTIEPGVYLPGVGGFRHSDTVLVTETGNRSLTPLPDSLEDMTLPIRD